MTASEVTIVEATAVVMIILSLFAGQRDRQSAGLATKEATTRMPESSSVPAFCLFSSSVRDGRSKLGRALTIKPNTAKCPNNDQNWDNLIG